MALDRTKMQTPPPQEPSTPQHWTVDAACWRSYCEDLIYAAASLTGAGSSFAYQIGRRRRLTPDQHLSAVRAGGACHEALLALWSEAPSGLALAQHAWGYDLHIVNDLDEDGQRKLVAWNWKGEVVARGKVIDIDQLRRQRQDATLARCARWLPKPPPSAQQRDQAERDRRAGITPEQRQTNADQLAAEMVRA